MPPVSFIGIDLAWKVDGNHSGLAVLVGDHRQVRLTAVADDVTSLAGIVEFVTRHARADCVAAVDASLIVVNATGQRPCETLIAKTFGRYHAACHTSNLGRPHATTGMALVAALRAHGFDHEFDLAVAKQRPGRWLFESYPHPAMVRLFALERIIRYKKGTVVEKRAGLATLCGHLAALASGTKGLVETPLLRGLLERDVTILRGRDLKRHEDTLDAVFCAYLAWHCWRWGAEKNQMFGTLSDGYIVVPCARDD